MAWADEVSEALVSPPTFSDDPERFFADVTLNPGETAHCAVDVNFDDTPINHAQVSVYTSTDDGATWDDTALLRFVVDNGIDENQVSWTIRGVHTFRVGIVALGSETHDGATFKHRKDGISL